MKLQINPEVIIGIILITFGFSLLAKLIWNIDIPIFRPLLAIFLIYWGLSLLFGTNSYKYYKQKIYTYTIHHDKDND